MLFAYDSRRLRSKGVITTPNSGALSSSFERISNVKEIRANEMHTIALCVVFDASVRSLEDAEGCDTSEFAEFVG